MKVWQLAVVLMMLPQNYRNEKNNFERLSSLIKLYARNDTANLPLHELQPWPCSFLAECRLSHRLRYRDLCKSALDA